MKKSVAAAWLAIALAGSAYSLDLSLSAADLVLEQRGDGGYHLFVRKKADIGSVMLVESTKDPGARLDSFAYRAAAWNPVNGDERRLLDGRPIAPGTLFSLIDSTPEAHPALGQAFHVFIPYVVEYGYPWSRNGRIYVADGTFFNIRAFQKPYGDYSGAYRDNPFVMRLEQRSASRDIPAPTDDSRYLKDAKDAFEDLAKSAGGAILYSAGPADIVGLVSKMLDSAKGKSLDIVLCIDATQSMEDDLDAIKRELPALLRARAGEFKSLRIGVVLYRDYPADFVTKTFQFTADLAAFDAFVQGVTASGGGDIPEAVDEALFAAIDGFPWAAEARLVILVGDAPPHPVPRGKVTREMVLRVAVEKSISLNVILLPH